MIKPQVLTSSSSLFPEKLHNIDTPPKRLRYIGDLETALAKPLLAIVGSRKVTPYGTAVTSSLAKQAAEQGITIVSGLALGVDGLAHQAALDAHGSTIAVLPSGLSKIYPATHHSMAQRIIESGGVLITEYPDEAEPLRYSFIERNRIISGISDAVLITEAAAKSGSLHTANFALDQGRTVMAVPGNITSQFSAGTNNLIKSGAIPVTEIRDILAAMGLQTMQKTWLAPLGDNPEQTSILDLLATGVTDGAELLRKSELAPASFNQSLTMLEIQGKIRPIGAGHWSLL